MKCSRGRPRPSIPLPGSEPRRTFAAGRRSTPFRLSRRTAALPDREPSQLARRDAVRSVVQIPSVPVKCIQVAHPSGLFLAGRDLMVTHNSWLVTDLALEFEILYDLGV